MINNLYIKATPTTAAVTWGSITGTLSAQTDLQSALNAKQATLVSGTNIKTINSTSLLGSGNVAVQPTLVSGTNIVTINSTSLLGSGNIAVQPTLVSGTNIKTINGNSLLGSGDLVVGGGGSSNPSTVYINTTGGATVGTPLTQTISLSVLIPANTLTSNSMLQVIYKVKRITGAASGITGSAFLNTSNSLSGAIIVAACPSIGTTQTYTTLTRNFHLTGGNLCYLSTTGAQLTDFVTDQMMTTPFDITIDNYLLFCIRTVGGGDTARTEAALLTKYF